MNEAARTIRAASIAFALLCAGGCATPPLTMPVQPARAGASIRTLVIESPLSIDAGRLRKVLAPSVEQGSAAERQLLSQGEQHAQGYAIAAMEASLRKSGRFEVIGAPATGSSAVEAVRTQAFATPISRQEAEALRESTGADAVLRFGITDYGLTPVAWRNGYIAFEVATTLGIAAIIAYSGSVVAKGAAGAYLVQETIEETAEGYAGFHALDVVSRPVRIQAQLVSLNPPGLAWQTSETGLSDTKLSRVFRKVPADERNRQLDEATGDAIDDVVAGLETALKRAKPP